MRSDAEKDFDRSAEALHRIVFPLLQVRCPEFHQTRLLDIKRDFDAVHTALDTVSGIDALLRSRNGLRPIAVRVQKDPNYQTFTIRTSRPNLSATELQKRFRELQLADQGVLSPYFTLQAYVTSDYKALLSVAVCKSAEMFAWLHDQIAAGKTFTTRYSPDGEGFVAIPWDDYRCSGNYLFVYSGPGDRAHIYQEALVQR